MNSMSPDELSEDEKAEADAALNQAVGEDCDKLSKAILHLRRALGLVPEEGVFEANDKFFVEERRWDGAHKYLKVPNAPSQPRTRAWQTLPLSPHTHTGTEWRLGIGGSHI